MKPKFQYLALLSLLFLNSFCYSIERRYNYGNPYSPAPAFSENDPQFEEGEPVWIVDKLGHYVFSLPSKVILLNWSMENHNLSEETKNHLKNYIRENNLRDVKVRFNQYAPLSEWRRLGKNENVNVFARYTLGSLSLLAYTFLPERLLAGLIGGDHYNPFTNTINVYSDSAAVLIHEGGHAKDFAQRENKTTYALIRAIPIVGALYQEARATDDTLNYFAEKNDKKKLEESYDILSPAYGTYVGGSIGDVIVAPATALAVIPGHIYGRYKKRSIDSQLSQRKIRLNESK
ncbi:hypothetical protein LPTSP4_33760 [Leptospira ryugenii]|uniref:Uncharacterized protein n=1 Tax=Leptospira ryugenii TaxID=1917863 RepID=A0A2P2E4M6_9LEPT|nr:hypothetical protein [Leptospira ryugenii]GBF51838.1 hypothetical protein LPTSP4_33760 [Leptospira ryugenii]